MKKAISIILIVILFALPLSFSYADTSNTIQSQFAKQGNASAKQWYSSDKNRALLTVLLAADVFPSMKNFNTDDMVEFLNNISYVGISSSSRQVLVIGYYGSTNIISIIYTPSTDEIQYTIMEASGTISASVMDGILSSSMQSIANNKEYSKNNQSLVLEKMKDIIEID